MPIEILRFSTKDGVPSIRSLTGLSRAAVYNRIQRGLFPRAVRLGPRTAGWPRHEVEALNGAVIAGRTDAELQELVRKLEAARANAG